MADSVLLPVLKKYINSIATYLTKKGDKKIGVYFFKKRYHHGCGGHPTLEEQKEMADELIAFLKI